MPTLPEAPAAYKKLLKRARAIALASSAAQALTWDQETYMPAKSLPYRAEQLAWLTGHAHRQFISRQVGQWISECEQHGFSPESSEAGNLREWRRQYDRATKISSRLVEKLERVRAHAREAWRQARQQSKFSLVKPHLDKVLALNRQMADCWGFKESPYDALVEGYEPSATASQLRQLFAELRPAISSLLAPAVAKSANVPKGMLQGQYPVAAQQAFNRKVAEAIGFDFNAGRIDTTTHPFCSTLGAGDCRLTRFPPITLRRAARGWTRHVRARAADGGLRHAEWHRRLTRHSRIAIAPVGKSRRTRPGVLGAMAFGGLRAFSRIEKILSVANHRRRQSGFLVLHPRRGRPGDLRPPHHPSI
jgi:carboxypeptidase Taq